MKTYFKKYECIDIKGTLDEDADGNKCIVYGDKDDINTITIKSLLDMIDGGYIQIKTLVD
jgi:hypothetical protein